MSTMIAGTMVYVQRDFRPVLSFIAENYQINLIKANHIRPNFDDKAANS